MKALSTARATRTVAISIFSHLSFLVISIYCGIVHHGTEPNERRFVCPNIVNVEE